MCFDECEYVRLSVVVQTAALRYSPYSEDQLELFRLVYMMRERDQLTFRVIAKKISEMDFCSALGTHFGPENVFSLYKKGMIRSNRLRQNTIKIYDIIAISHTPDKT